MPSETLPINPGDWSAVSEYLGLITPVFNPRNYGAVADCVTVGDGAITSGLTALTSAAGLFRAADVGKTVIVSGAGSAGDDLRTTIAAYVSATQVTTAAAAGGTVSAAGVSWGTDNKTAFDSALAAATPTLISGRYVGAGRLKISNGSYLTSGGHTWPLLVTIEGEGQQPTNLIHTGNNTCFTQSGSAPGAAPVGSYGRHGISNLAIWGNNGASAIGTEFRGKQWEPFLDDVMIGSYSNGIGLLLNNVTAGDFVEGVRLNGTLRSNKTGAEIRRTSGNASFAYQRWLDFNIHVPASGTGILIGDTSLSSALCQVYSGVFVGNIWLEGNNAIAVKVGQFGSVESNNDWRVKGEVISGTGTKSLSIDSGGKFYPRGIHDFGIDGAQAQPTVDVGNATIYRPPTRVTEVLQTMGFNRETFDRGSGIQGATAPTAGVIVATLCDFRRGDVVKGITLGVSANGVGVTLAKVGVCSSSGTLLQGSADNSANFNAGTTGRGQDTDLSAAWTCPDDGAYLLAAVFVSGTAPTLIRGVSLAAATGWQRGSSAFRASQSAGGKTDLATFAPLASGVSYWFGTYDH